MRPSISALICLLALTGCETDQERMVKAMEKQIHETIQADWRMELPLNSLVQAAAYCQKRPSLNGCDILQAQMQDIAISFASCRADQRSALCMVVIDAVSNHPIAAQLHRAKPLKLPDTPWYWEMPTTSLDALSGKHSYRKEAFLWWWEKWNFSLLSCLALLFAGRIAWIIWQDRRNAQQRQRALLAHQQAEREKQERIRQHLQAQARAEANHHARLEREADIARRKQLAEEQAAKQKAAEASAKLAAEQAEATELLNALFRPSDSKQGKHDSLE